VLVSFAEYVSFVGLVLQKRPIFLKCLWADFIKLEKFSMPSVAVLCNTGSVAVHCNTGSVAVHCNTEMSDDGGEWTFAIGCLIFTEYVSFVGLFCKRDL